MKDFRWDSSVVTHLHIELSNFCNAACPFCPRHVEQSSIVRPDLEMDSITIKKFKEWFPPNFLQKIERILFCGTHGDPMMCKDILEITEYIQEHSPDCTLIYHTNGGMRKPEFWQTLGKMVKKKHSSHVIFSVDGLEDTNHLYRRNVKWQPLQENIKAFINAGGRALWEFLIFKHNEHQLEEAEKLSKKLGFEDIYFKRALGFEDQNGGVVKKGVYNKEGDLEYTLSPPSNDQFVNTSNIEERQTHIPLKKDYGYINNNYAGYNEAIENKLKNFNEAEIPKFNRYINDYEEHEITCKSCAGNNRSEIYISCNGIVFPCCYVGTRVDSSIDLYEDTQLRNAIRSFGKEKFNLNYTDINEIINEGYLDKVYSESWKKQKFTQGKLAYCAMTCGKNSQIDKIYMKDRFKL